MAQKRLNTLEDWESQVCSWRTNNDVNWKSGCARMENGNEGERERKKKKKEKKKILVGGQEPRNDGKRNLFSGEEKPPQDFEKKRSLRAEATLLVSFSVATLPDDPFFRTSSLPYR